MVLQDVVRYCPLSPSGLRWTVVGTRMFLLQPLEMLQEAFALTVQGSNS